jgi:hypothetical protein
MLSWTKRRAWRSRTKTRRRAKPPAPCARGWKAGRHTEKKLLRPGRTPLGIERGREGSREESRDKRNTSLQQIAMVSPHEAEPPTWIPDYQDMPCPAAPDGVWRMGGGGVESAVDCKGQNMLRRTRPSRAWTLCRIWLSGGEGPMKSESWDSNGRSLSDSR